jgi:hypothetical protein
MTDSDHRPLAVSCFNRCWDIIEAPERSAADERELLSLAFTSRWHWGFVGGPTQFIIGDWMIARAASVVGEHHLARRFIDVARDALDNDSPDWLRASVAEGSARAARAAGDEDLFRSELTRARELVAAIAGAEDRDLIAAQLAEIEPLPEA